MYKDTLKRIIPEEVNYLNANYLFQQYIDGFFNMSDTEIAIFSTTSTKGKWTTF